MGDLAFVAATLILASNSFRADGTSPARAGPAYAVLLVVAAIIGLRHFAWDANLPYAGFALLVGFLAEQAGLVVLPSLLQGLAWGSSSSAREC